MGWTNSLDFAVGERLTASKMDQVMANVQALFDWIGRDYTLTVNHNHDGTDSNLVNTLNATLVASASVTLSGSSPAEWTASIVGSGNTTRYLFDVAMVVSANTGAALYAFPFVRWQNYGAVELVVETSSLSPGTGTTFQVAAWRRTVPS